MSDNNVTVEMVEEELFKIVKGDTVTTSAESATGRVEAARLLLEILERRSMAEREKPVARAVPIEGF